jgi:hypothetical protein
MSSTKREVVVVAAEASAIHQDVTPGSVDADPGRSAHPYKRRSDFIREALC